MVKHNVLTSGMYPQAIGTLDLSNEFKEYISMCQGFGAEADLEVVNG